MPTDLPVKPDPFVAPWHPDRKGMVPSEAPAYLKRVYGLRASVASIKSWVNKGIKGKGGPHYLIAHKVSGQWIILKRDLIAFVEFV